VFGHKLHIYPAGIGRKDAPPFPLRTTTLETDKAFYKYRLISNTRQIMKYLKLTEAERDHLDRGLLENLK
jgi:hypothetical protein